jgi:hypothetical protein
VSGGEMVSWKTQNVVEEDNRILDLGEIDW